jgi:hypothetical protein
MTATWSGSPSPAAAGYGGNPGEGFTYHLVITNHPATRLCNCHPESRRQVCYLGRLQASCPTVGKFLEVEPETYGVLRSEDFIGFVCNPIARLRKP